MSRRVEVLESQLPNFRPHQTKYRDELIATAQKMLAPGKGLLAADESEGTCAKRFAGIGLANNAENRRRYRDLMLGADGLENYISGVILHDETFRQKNDAGVPFPEVLARKGIVTGIKTDKGLVPLISGAPGEEATQGLDGYLKRAQEYYKGGARFCKWRNTYRIQNGTVSEAAVQHNAETLARYAVLSQAAGLVPMVEPEVMLVGNHSLEDCLKVSERVWSVMVKKFHHYGVLWEGMVLKPNMVVPGAESGVKAAPQQVGLATVTALGRTMPAAMPGVMFLSGGLSEVQASEYLNAINNAPLARPWALRFSYARALQASALKAWGGKPEGVPAGRRVL
eukprot:PhM_4_TR9109/c0_g1_i1/m.83607/K01623/ALDO; fructose-bisphosphate aldolase, class I